MDHGESQRVSILTFEDIKEECEMRKKCSALLLVFMVLLLFFPVSVHAAETENQNAEDILSQVKQQLSAVFENVDQETAEEVFSFLKEKIGEGNLNSEEGLSRAIEEGKEKFGVEISKEDARKLVDAMEKLEDIGFSADYVMDKAQTLYKQYGADFVEHVDELLTDAVKNAATNAMNSFWDNLKNSIKDFFSSLFS